MLQPNERDAWRAFLGHRGSYPLIGLATGTIALTGAVLIMDLLRPSGSQLTGPVILRLSPILIPFILVEILHNLCLRFMRFRLNQPPADWGFMVSWWKRDQEIMKAYRQVYGRDFTASAFRWYPLLTLLLGVSLFFRFVEISR